MDIIEQSLLNCDKHKDKKALYISIQKKSNEVMALCEECILSINQNQYQTLVISNILKNDGVINNWPPIKDMRSLEQLQKEILQPHPFFKIENFEQKIISFFQQKLEEVIKKIQEIQKVFLNYYNNNIDLIKYASFVYQDMSKVNLIKELIKDGKFFKVGVGKIYADINNSKNQNQNKIDALLKCINEAKIQFDEKSLNTQFKEINYKIDHILINQSNLLQVQEQTIKQIKSEYIKIQNKIVFLGEGVGKTAIIYQIVENTFKYSTPPCIGFREFRKDLIFDNAKYNLGFIDTSCQEQYFYVNSKFLLKQQVFVLVYDITFRASLQVVLMRLRNIEKKGMKDSLVFILGNKVDLDNEIQLTQEEVKQIVTDYTTIKKIYFYEVSAKTRYNIDSFLNKLCIELQSLFMDQLKINLLKK